MEIKLISELMGQKERITLETKILKLKEEWENLYQNLQTSAKSAPGALVMVLDRPSQTLALLRSQQNKASKRKANYRPHVGVWAPGFKVKTANHIQEHF